MKDSTYQPIHQLLVRYPVLLPCREALFRAVDLLIACYQSWHKVLVCGNGGSAADSQHIVGELMKSFVLPRPLDASLAQRLRQIAPLEAEHLIQHLQGALPAISLVGETALSTAFANDVAPELAFAQQVLGLGASGDVLIAISTSGHSANVLQAVRVAQAKDMIVIALTGRDGGILARLADCSLVAPAEETYQIQELHLPIYHAICLAVEESFFGS